MDLVKILIKYSPSQNRPCGIRNLQTIHQIEAEIGLNGVALMKELDKIPHVSYRQGSNEPASISLNGGFPIK